MTAVYEPFHFCLAFTVPGYGDYRFLAKWAHVRYGDGGRLSPHLEWTLSLGGNRVVCPIKNACVVDGELGMAEARMTFEWKPTLTLYFRCSQPFSSLE